MSIERGSQTAMAIMLVFLLIEPLLAKKGTELELTPQEEAAQKVVAEREAALTRGLKPRKVVHKPGTFASQDIGAQTDGRVKVKFADGLAIRATDGRLHDSGTGVLKRASKLASLGDWYPLNDLGEERLNRVREKAMHRSGEVAPNFTLEFLLVVKDPTRTAAVLNELNGLDIVEVAFPWTEVQPSLLRECDRFYITLGYQEYLGAAFGVNASDAWHVPGGAGQSVRVGVIDGYLNPNHPEIAHNGVIIDRQACQGFLDTWWSTDPITARNNIAHGTAVVGILAGVKEDEELPGSPTPPSHGITGVAYGAQLRFISTYRQDFLGRCNNDMDSALARALDVLDDGDVLSISIAAKRPLHNWDYVPIEFDPFYWLKIRALTNAGVTVVTCAGNSGVNLDTVQVLGGVFHQFAVYPDGTPKHDSGSIIVGGGEKPSRDDQGGIRCIWSPHPITLKKQESNFGKRVNLQGLGSFVDTAYLRNQFDENTDWCTDDWSGTSAATPIVAGACALVQSVRIARNLPPMTG